MQSQEDMMRSTIYKNFLFTKFCSSATENLDLRLAKHQQVCLLNECSHTEEYLHLITRTSNIVIFVRFCCALLLRHDIYLELSTRQLICLSKECIKFAEYNGDMGPMELAIFLFVTMRINLYGYEEQNDSKETIFYGKKCINIAKEMGDKQRERGACYVVGNACFNIKNFQDAVLYYKKSFELAKETSNRDFVMHASLNLGIAYVKLWQYEDAIFYIKNCIDVSKETGKREVEMYAHLAAGRAYAGLKNYDNAIISHKKQLTIARETGDRKVEMDAHLIIGQAYAELQQFENAISSCKQSIAIANETGNREVEMNANLELGRAYAKLLQYDIANVYFNHCIQIAKEQSNNVVEMNSYQGLALTHAKLELHDDAILYGRKSIDIAKHTGDKETENKAYIILVEIYMYLQQYKEAVSCVKKCIEIAKEIEGESAMMDSCSLAAGVLSLAGQYEESIVYSKRALEISEKTCDSRTEMISYFLLGFAYGNLNQYESAIIFSEKCIETAKKIGDKIVEMKAHFNLVETLKNLPLLNEAFIHLNKGKDIALELNNDEFIDRSRVLQCILDIFVGIINQFNPDEQVVREFIDIPKGNEQDLLDAIDEAMKTEDITKQSQALMRHFCFCHSKKEYEKALASAKYLKKVLLDTETKLFCNKVILKLYMLMRKFDQALAYCWEILPEMEESGSKVHQSLFYSMFGQLLYRDDQLDASEKYLRKALQCFEIVFASLGSNDEFKISIIDKYFDCYKCLSLVLSVTNQFDEALVVSDGCRARALKDLLVSSFGMNKEGIDHEERREGYPDIQAFAASSNGYNLLFYSLFPDGVLLFFNDTKENTFKVVFQEFKMRGKSAGFLNILLDHAFDELDARQVDKCENRSLDVNQENTKRRNGEEDSIYTSATVAHLRKDILQHITRSDPRQETSRDLNAYGNVLEFLYNNLISPVERFLDQDEIVIIPEGQLNCVPFAALQDPDTGKYLSETKRIRLAPSIATLKVLQKLPEDRHHRKGALIIGGPLVGEVMMDGEVTIIETLFGALNEAIDIADLLGVSPLVAANATKPAVLEKLREGVSVVHIAAHGILSKATIVLAPSDEIRATKIPDEEDYMLTMADVQQAKVRAQLVVLSCCHSGRGEIRAEGVVGMCRAFLASGTRAVVASLWAIDDEATLEFMKTFYGHLKKGSSASRSLQLAMDGMRQSEIYKEPKYWAPFFLMGDDVTINFTN